MIQLNELTGDRVPTHQPRGPIRLGPSPVVACGPCTIEVQNAWRKRPKSRVMDPQPAVRGVKKRHLVQHLRDVHGVDIHGDAVKPRRQGCTHQFRTSAKCARCGTTLKRIRDRKR